MVIKKFSIIIPVFNNEQTINLLYREIKKVFKKIKANYEIIFVDDGSPDNSYRKIKNICEVDKNVICVKLTKNFGQRFATIAGLEYSSGDYVINLDADLQDPPELIKKFYDKIKNKNTDLLIAARNSVKESLFRKFTSFVQHKILSILIKEYPIDGFTVWCISRSLAEKIKKRGNKISLLPLEILNYGYKHETIFYDREKRIIGNSQWTFYQRIDLAIEMIIHSNFSILRFCLYLGTFLLFLSFFFIMVVIYSYFNNSTPFQGYSPIIIISLFLGGLNIFFLGTITEYISTIIKKINLYDFYNVEKIINKNK